MRILTRHSGRLSVWNNFCREHEVDARSVPLFEASGGRVSIHRYGVDNRLVLKRSSDMESLVIHEVEKVINDYNAEKREYDGVIYMMLWKDSDLIIPLYIGKSEKIGRNGSLSVNIKNIRRNSAYFCRWGYNYAYHMGDLSAIVCPGHHSDKMNRKYYKWAERLFTAFPDVTPTLRRDTFFWIEAWKHGSTGIWKDYGATSLTFLEYLLIGVSSDLFSDLLLNSEGVNRS
jgi:hypothetical protein